MHEVKIETQPTRRLAAIAHRGPYQGIGDAFRRLGEWGVSKGAFGPTSEMLGVYYDDPRTTPAEKLRADACLTAPSGFNGDESAGIRVIDLAGGEDAVVVHRGDYSGLPGVWEWLYTQWLPGCGRACDPARPSFEIYLNSPAMVAPEELLTAVHAPLAPA